MWVQVLMAVIGLSAGMVVAAGLFSFISELGVVSDFADRTHTGEHILLYENSVALGGILGNILDIYEFPIGFGGNLVLGAMGLSVGIFVGCLVMSLAETLKTLPVISRRIHLSVGLQYVILAIGLGKMLGSLLYFSAGIGRP